MLVTLTTQDATKRTIGLPVRYLAIDQRAHTLVDAASRYRSPADSPISESLNDPAAWEFHQAKPQPDCAKWQAISVTLGEWRRRSQLTVQGLFRPHLLRLEPVHDPNDPQYERFYLGAAV